MNGIVKNDFGGVFSKWANGDAGSIPASGQIIQDN